MYGITKLKDTVKVPPLDFGMCEEHLKKFLDYGEIFDVNDFFPIIAKQLAGEFDVSQNIALCFMDVTAESSWGVDHIVPDNPRATVEKVFDQFKKDPQVVEKKKEELKTHKLVGVWKYNRAEGTLEEVKLNAKFDKECCYYYWMVVRKIVDNVGNKFYFKSFKNPLEKIEMNKVLVYHFLYQMDNGITTESNFFTDQL